MAVMQAPRALGALERVRDRYGRGEAARKLAWLRVLARAELASPRALERLHEALCYLRAYPDDAAVLDAVERMLARFATRADLRAHAARLANSGIAGTAMYYPFFWPTARWLAERVPRALELDRDDVQAGDNIAAALSALVSVPEANALRELQPEGYAALDRVRVRAPTDATYLIDRIASMPGDDFTREGFHDRINPSYVLRSGPSRTEAKYRAAPFAYQSASPRRDRPDLREEAARAPLEVRTLAPREGERIIELARGAMVSRERDLDAFAYGDRRDVRLVDDGNGLAFALNGVTPARRTLLPAIFGGLTLRNGVPIGYSQLDIIGRTCALSFNTFATFRGGEASYTLARLVAVTHHLFGVTSFSIEPYQLGKDNAEGLASGAWWFYYKHGFRPRTPEALALMRSELARMRARPSHRSSEATLARLAQWHVFFELDAERPQPLPRFAELGRRVTLALGRHGEGGSDLVLRLTGLARKRSWIADERTAWARWYPLALAIPGVARWPLADRRALGEVILAKAARSESEFVRRFAAHARLSRSLLD